MTPVSGLEEIHPQSGEIFLQVSLEERLGRAPVVPWNPFIENWEESERLVGGQKEPKVLKFVIISFRISWLFAVIAGTRKN